MKKQLPAVFTAILVLGLFSNVLIVRRPIVVHILLILLMVISFTGIPRYSKDQEKR